MGSVFVLGRVDLAGEVEVLRQALVDAFDPEVARDIEAAAAAIYWSGWAGNDAAVPRFTTADAKRLPEHWRRFDTRRSVLTTASGNRNAERPLNALLNYLFSLLETECVLACWAVGLDPGLGVVHADTRGRQSMALDIMEAVRPDVEEWVLRLLASPKGGTAVASLPPGGGRGAGGGRGRT